MLKVQKFIKDNPADWSKTLSQKPYAIKIQEDKHFFLLKYNQIDSDFKNEIVRECRGIILDKHDLSVVCHPFHKFGNYGESYVPEIDWASASVQEKLDGSLIKCWYNRHDKIWQWSTNGTINAFDASLQDNIVGLDSFGELVYHTLITMKMTHLVETLNIAFTYLFELCTPLNRVVVPHSDYKLYHLVTKHNLTEAEDTDFIDMPQPNRYDLRNLQDCVDATTRMPFNEEGYVVVDKDLNRVKIKSPAYLAVHHLKGEGTIVPRRALDLIRANEHNELLGYFPEYKEYFDNLEKVYNKFVEIIHIEMLEAKMKLASSGSRKSFAKWAKDRMIPSIMFSVYDGRYDRPDQALASFPSEKLLKFLVEEI